MTQTSTEHKEKSSSFLPFSRKSPCPEAFSLGQLQLCAMKSFSRPAQRNKEHEPPPRPPRNTY